MTSGALTVDDLSVAYGESEVLHELSLTAEPGEILAIMGLNGMGKSTLMKTLIGLLPARSGTIKIGDKVITDSKPYERVREGLAYVPQGRMVFGSLSVEENILSGVRSDRDGVPEELYTFFPVLKEMRRRRAGNLSGGQQQQLAIARALASQPKVLLLDEPTEGIQPSIIKELANILKRIRDLKQLTIVVSEQVLSFALSVADRVLVINGGRFIHEGARGELDATALGNLLSL
jgi:urea transport system ATP-binding protein